ncbi:MAG: O-antigen ligase family protein [Candidatus Staskawiczbacteria bacterium]|nr:O-antigen ligase family protein [Candidatus Staskawiczbacteria bacterium]
MKNNINEKKLHWLYSAGLFIILALPILTLPPWFYPPDWGKVIIFRSLLAIMLFFFAWNVLYKKDTFTRAQLKNYPVLWALGAFFVVFLLASIFSVSPGFSFWGSPYRAGGTMNLAFYSAFTALAFCLLKKEHWEKVWILSIAVGVFVSLVGLIQLYGLFNNVFVSVGNRPGSTIGNPIFLGIYLLLLFFPSLALAIKEPFDTAQGKLKKIFYIFSGLIFLYTILITGSRAAYLGIVVGASFFLLFYPKKFKLLKVCLALFLISIFLTVSYVNTRPEYPSGYPKILQNRITEQIIPRLSVKKAFGDERFMAWQTVVKEIKDRPILGWGPENLSVGFDKNYNPTITPSPWWDKAHNIFLDIGAQAGILGILAYVFLFIVLFQQLHKAKSGGNALMAGGVQATLAGYLTANFFSFDSFPTYLIFFLIISYTLYLSSPGKDETKNTNQPPKIIKPHVGPAIMFVLFCILIIFLWQYNLMPAQINKQINVASNLIDQKKCDAAFAILDKQLQSHSFLDSFVRMEYVNDIKICASYFPGNDSAYAKKGVELLKEAVKIQSLYTRYWIYLGGFTTIIADNERDAVKKENLILEAYSYFDKAEKLSPLHTETLLERAKANMVAGNYGEMKINAEKCLSADSISGGCYWIKGLAELYLGDINSAKADLQKAQDKGYDVDTLRSMYDLVNAYAATKNYQDLSAVYLRLIKRDPTVPEYHSSLAFTYAKMKEYQKSREEALRFLQLMPGAKDEVDAFLKTLPN